MHVAPAPAKQEQPLFNGPHVDIGAIYRSASLSADELDRVVRAEGLLHLLPSTASQTREIVDATFRAFGVDRTLIIDAAGKQLDALERFVRFSQEQTQTVLDVSARRIAELEAEIARCREEAAQATREGEERARTVNNEMQKVQHVLEFFGSEDGGAAEVNLDDSTGTSRSAAAPPAVPRAQASSSSSGSTAKPPQAPTR